MNWENLIVNLECIDSLPTLPTVFSRVSQLMADPNVTAKSLANVIETDPAISMKLLKIVNSPFFGFSRKIMTVHDAVVLLGFNATRNTVLSVSIIRALPNRNKVEGFSMDQFWKHSICTGLIARFLARRYQLDPEKAFVAGIIHDIGKVILEQYFENEIVRVLETMASKKINFYDAELEVYGGTHCDLGSYLADKWNLPIPLIEVIDMHHTPAEAVEDPRLVSVVHIANAVGKGLGYGFSPGDHYTDLDSYAFSRLDISASELEEWLEDIREEISVSQQLFDLIR